MLAVAQRLESQPETLPVPHFFVTIFWHLVATGTAKALVLNLYKHA